MAHRFLKERFWIVVALLLSVLAVAHGIALYRIASHLMDSFSRAGRLGATHAFRNSWFRLRGTGTSCEAQAMRSKFRKFTGLKPVGGMREGLASLGHLRM